MNFKDFLIREIEELSEIVIQFRGAGVIPYCEKTERYLFTLRCRHVSSPLTWAGFGGEIDERETPEQAAKRELFEEAGYDGQINLKPIFTFDDSKIDFIYHNFVGTVPEEFEPELNWENVDFRWIKKGEWPKPLHPGIKQFINLL